MYNLHNAYNCENIVFIYYVKFSIRVSFVCEFIMKQFITLVVHVKKSHKSYRLKIEMDIYSHGKVWFFFVSFMLYMYLVKERKLHNHSQTITDIECHANKEWSDNG
jgi:hypothetical protein